MRRIRGVVGAAFVAGVVLVPAVAPASEPVAAAPTDAVRDAEYWLDDYGIRQVGTSRAAPE